MRTFEATISSKGQVAVPVAVRRHLGVEKGERVRFVLDDDGVHLLPVPYTLETVRGAIPALPGVSDDFDVEIEAAMQDHVDRIVARVGHA